MLIAESGSTKTEWRLLKGGQIHSSFRTRGFNPNVEDVEAMSQDFYFAFENYLQGKDVPSVYFYGAGLGGDSQKQVIRDILSRQLEDAEIYVDHDMRAAARSTGREEGIVCILGTGSNSCYYKGDQVLQNIGGHGYLFGDEGSGMDLGRNLIKGLLQNDFPKKVLEYIEEKEQNPIYEIKISVHKSPRPNVRMAEFSKYLDELVTYPQIRKMIKARFTAFLETTVCRYPDFREIPADFVGSVAFFFKAILEKCCQEKEVQLGTIIKDPIDNLIQFHLTHSKEKQEPGASAL